MENRWTVTYGGIATYKHLGKGNTWERVSYNTKI